jgi:cytochrome b subunit of formate dehydrogenase
MKKITYLTGTIFTMMALFAIIFRIMHWPGASELIVISIGGFALFFVPFFAKYSYDKKS